MEKSKTRHTGAKIWDIIGITLFSVLLLIGFLCFFAANWYVSVYGRLGFDSVLYTLTGGLSGVHSDLVTRFLLGAVLPTVLLTAAVMLLLFTPWKKLMIGKLKLLPVRFSTAGIITLVLTLILIVHAAFNVELVDYIIARYRVSSLYQEEYRDPDTTTITFPEKKRNLVYIMLESMETSYLGTAQGGAMDENLIPELYSLAQENINFSHSHDVGGFRQVSGASWTIGSMVAQTSGVPLKVPDGIDDWQNGYGKDGEFLPGLTTLSSILSENGYYQALMVGSDANFGGRYTYYDTHGTDKIYDIYTARRDGIVPSNYFVWWGMEDLYLFEYAKEALTEMAAGDQPFAFTMLTVDTHHIGGYKCELCGSTYEENYENVISCSSKQVYAFVQWLQQQPFYENTTVIVTGDHYSMDAGYFDRNVDDSYTRHVYNCFLNSAVEPFRTASRQFCALDMFPTTLAAMGCTIEGDRLGLGTNLFSDTPTLMEQMGYYTFNNELAKASDYYSDHFYSAKTEE